MKVLLKRAAALLFSVVIILSLMPGSVSAQEMATVFELPKMSTGIMSSEVVSLREERVKHYDMGNGIFQAVAYSHPVHEKDSSGNWVDIDFGLKLSETKNERMYCNATAGTAFAEKYVPNQTVMELYSKGDSISMSLINASESVKTGRNASDAVVAEITNSNNSFKTFEEAKSAKFSSRVLYRGVLTGVDLEYIVDPGMVKENIIVKEKANDYQYKFSLNLIGMYPVVQKDGSIIVFDNDTDDSRYEMPAPFMYDALGNISENVNYSLERKGDNYILTVVADEHWINAEGRSFPVTIDPSYVESINTIDDAYIDAEHPSNPHGVMSMMWVRYDRFSYIKTATPTIPAGADLNWAALSAYYYYNDYVTTGHVNVTAHQMQHSWNEYTLTWDYVSQYANYGLGSAVLDEVSAAAGNATVNNPAQADFFITNVVKAWMNGTANYGIGLKYGANSTNLSVIFVPSEASYDYRPRLTYSYSHYGSTYRYINYYDSSLSAAQIGNIESAVGAANVAFSRQFGITFQSKNEPLYLDCLADACPAGTYNQCSDLCEVHHKNVNWIVEQLVERFDNIDATSHDRMVYWTDRPRDTYCNHKEDICYRFDTDAGGTTVARVDLNHRKIITFLNIRPDNGTNDQDLACMGINLIHETAHTLGMDEYYDDHNHGESGYQCVMETFPDETCSDPLKDAVTFYYSIADGSASAFCDQCADILSGMLPS